MKIKSDIGAALAVAFALALATAGQSPAFASTPQKDKKAEPPPQGKPVLWRGHEDASSLNLLHGPGGEGKGPDLSRVTFVKEETGGYSPKFRVTDGSGRVWVAKLGKEAQPETASVRLVWAAGYVTEASYLVPCVKIEGAPAPKKKVDRCEGNGFANVRFEARPDEYKRLEEWSWGQNPFKGTKEFQGLVVLMGLLNNWDLKDANNKIVYVPGGGGEGELRYIISDLGATFGKTGNFITHNRNEPETYAKTKFVEGVDGGRVRFAYDGKNAGLFSNITVEQAKWAGEQLSRLSDEQIADAFRAANYPPEEVSLLAGAVRRKINELVSLPGGAAAPVAAAPDSPGKQ
ncbi:MAG TPA: hypothetical protein VD968_19395 [Pyrinomonadaceae bacterium]|nr:hypothetical protein [Pyrinomonadaceae bacterium]